MSSGTFTFHHALIVLSLFALSLASATRPHNWSSRDTNTPPPDGGALKVCLCAAGITTSFPSNATWATDSLAWNARISPLPAGVAYPTDEAQVSAALGCARAHGAKVATLGGNRSFSSMGFGRTDGALVLDMRAMRRLEFDDDSGRVVLGGNVTISDVARFLWERHARGLPHGRCPDVGMTGLALGGGFGTLSRARGTVLDNVEAARVALANGTVVDASATQNADLFWALRGAGPSVGVVLSLAVRTVEPPARVTNYTIAFPAGVPTAEQNVDALLGVQAWAQSDDSDDMLSARFYLRKSVSISGWYYGEDFGAASQSLMARLPQGMTLATNESDYWASEEGNTPGIQQGTMGPRRFFWIDAVTVRGAHPLTRASATQLFNSTVYAPPPPDGATPSGFLDVWAGGYNKGVKPDAAAWQHDDNLFLVRWDVRSSAANVSFSQPSLAAVRSNFYKFVDAYKAEGGNPGGFPNYRDSEWDAKGVAEYLYGSNWDRLLQVKKALDPDGLFNSDPQSVPVV